MVREHIPSHEKQDMVYHLSSVSRSFTTSLNLVENLQKENLKIYSELDVLKEEFVKRDKANLKLEGEVEVLKEEIGTRDQLMMDKIEVMKGKVHQIETLQKANLKLEGEVKVLKEEIVNQFAAKFMWRIRDVEGVINAAKEMNTNGEVESGHFTGPHNYSFKLKARLNGGISGRVGETFSLYLYNVSNDFDSILDWPVRISFELILLHPQNHSLDNKRIIENRPFEKAGGRGFGNYMPLDKLRTFISNDSLFIKCIIWSNKPNLLSNE